jgi:putative N6-adenine-specific DNA methylase
MFNYQQTQQYFAQVAGGMEEIGSEELKELNAFEIQSVYRGIYFKADKATLYRINYCSRVLSRILAPLKIFKCHDADYLYRAARPIEWDLFFEPNQTFAIFSQVSNSKINHSRYAALRVKDAVVDYFRERYDQRPRVNRTNPNAWINLHIENDLATISFDTSGGALHRRGYRQKTVDAPIQETLAAAIIRLSEWDGSTPLIDPMCGSGTLLSEAILSYCHIPSGYKREKFGFEMLPDFDKNIWEQIKSKRAKLQRELPAGLVSGYDISKKAVAAAKANLQNIPNAERVKLKISDFQDLSGFNMTTIICNPPYGIRMGDKKKLKNLYKLLGDFLKQRCKDSTAYIYFGDRQFISHIGLKTSWKKQMFNGALDGRLAKFELY